MKKSLLVGLTYDLASDYFLENGAPEDFYGEYDSEETIERLETAILGLGYSVYRIGNIDKLVSFLAEKQRVDIVFNIAEGRWGRNRESQIPALLEAYSIPYTFSDPFTLGICLDKAFAKRLWQLDGLPVAPFYLVESPLDFCSPLEMGLEFPLFVKPVREGSSKGIGLESVVETVEQLKTQVERVMTLYQQPALVEEFLPGREFTVAVIGSGPNAKVLGALEVPYVAVSRVDGFLQKNDWNTYSLSIHKPVGESPLLKQLTEVSLRAFQALGCRDAGRLDLRMDKNGQLVLMEINPLPGLSSHSALPYIAALAGISFKMLLDGILREAIARSSREIMDKVKCKTQT